jgi:hypothetical protein
MTINGNNGHASFIVSGTTTSEQAAKLIRKGQPTVTNDRLLEIAGHNEANWSANGSSQLQVPGHVQLFGPSSFTNFSWVAEEALDLANWHAVSEAATNNGQFLTITLPLTNSQKFFRLKGN